MDDKELNKKLKHNDKNALKYLFDVYHEGLFRYALKIILNNEAAEEIVQDIFISIWRKRNESEIENFKYYLLKAVKFRCINYIKEQVRNAEKTEDYFLADNTEKNTPQHILEGKELATTIEEAINRLPEKCRVIFTLSRNAELSYKEIAAELNISIKTVENQIGIALKKLREMLKEYENI